MANVYLQDSTLTSIGNAIRSKTGETGLLLPSQMPAAIQSITGGGGNDKPYDRFFLNAPGGASGRLWNGWKTYFPTNADFDKIKLIVTVTTSNSRSIVIKENPEWLVAKDGSIRVKAACFLEYSSGKFIVNAEDPYNAGVYYALAFKADGYCQYMKYSKTDTGIYGSPNYAGVYLEKYK